MSKLHDEARPRFPNLGRLGIAIEEHLVEKIIGQAAIDEVKKPYAEKQIVEALGEALARVEDEFVRTCRDKHAADALRQLPVYDLPDVPDALWTFYRQTDERALGEILRRELGRVHGLTKERVDDAVKGYLRLLRPAFLNVDAELREKIMARAAVESAEANVEALETLKAILRVLSEGGGKQGAAGNRYDLPGDFRGASVYIQSTINSNAEVKDMKGTQPGALPPGSWLGGFPRNALFTGRDEELKRLEEALLGKESASTVISQAIRGMGGIGKTQLAVEFAYRHGYRLRGVHWLDLREAEQLDTQIAQCGAEMRMEGWPKELPEQVIATLARWKQDGPRLVILDNFEETKKGAQVLGRLQDPNLRLLITSRRTDWAKNLGLQPLELDVLSEDESVKFLRNYTEQRFTEDELRKLARRLGCLPLALELAGRYLEKHESVTLAEYEKKFGEGLGHETLKGFRGELPDASGHDRDLMECFAVSWKDVTDEKAQEAFQMAGYCAPNTAIPREVFAAALECEGEACDEALSELEGLGLLKEGLVMHPLLAEYARTLDGDKKALERLTDKLADIAVQRNRDVQRTANYALFQSILPHVRSVGEFAEAAKIERGGTLWNEVGFYLHPLADYKGAQAAFERAIAIGEKAFGTDHPQVAIYVNNLGSVLRALGDLAGAKAAFERALKIDEASYGPEHPNVAIRLWNLGTVLQAEGNTDRARACYERALAIFRKFLPEGHPYIKGVESWLKSLDPRPDSPE